VHANMAMCWCCRCAYCTAASASEAVSSMAEAKCKIAILAYIWHEGMLFGPSVGCVKQVGCQKASMVASNHHMHTSLSYTMRLSIPVRTCALWQTPYSPICTTADMKKQLRCSCDRTHNFFHRHKLSPTSYFFLTLIKIRI